jgi:hypothetical protein
MTPEEHEPNKQGIEFYGGYQVYSESGVDLTLLRENLRRPLEERWESNRRLLLFCRELQKSNPSRGMPAPFLQGSPHPTDALAVVKLLAANQAQYVVVGGMAMKAHGSAYVTADIDLCYQLTAVNLAALATALAAIHACPRGGMPGLPFPCDTATLAAGEGFRLMTDYGDVDLVGEVPGVGGYEQVLAQSEERRLLGLAIRVLSLDALIAVKRATGRRHDQLHLLELEELKKLRDAGGTLGA